MGGMLQVHGRAPPQLPHFARVSHGHKPGGATSISAGQGLPSALGVRNPGFQSGLSASLGQENPLQAAGWVRPVLGGIFPIPSIPCALKAGKTGVETFIPGGSNLQEPLSLFLDLLERSEVTGWGHEVMAALKNSLKNARN